MSEEVHFVACEIGARTEGQTIADNPELLKHYTEVAKAFILSLENTGTYIFRPDATFKVALAAWAKHHKVDGDLMVKVQQGLFQYLTTSTPK